MTVDGRVSRRDFLRLRTTERGRLLEVSCRALFMRCADATIVHEDVPTPVRSRIGDGSSEVRTA